MKKILFVGILSVLFVGASYAQPKIGITAGLNVSNLIESGTYSASNNFKAGFQAGVVADFGITENFSIMPELLFAQRGCKYKDADLNSTLNYLQLPVNAAYKFDVGYGSKLFIFAGPYIGYAVSGKVGSADIKFGSADDEMKAFDFGLNVGVGYEYEKVFFKLQYNPGLINMSHYTDPSIRNTNIAVSVGYYFN